MASEIQMSYTTGKVLYALVRNSVGQVWQTTSSTFVTYVTANLANYTISMSEQGTASGYYAGNMPAATGGVYNVIIKERIGGSAAETDTSVAIGTIDWDGSALVRNYSSSEINTAVQAGTWSTPNVNSVRDAITGGAYALSTDSNGRIRIVDGTGAGEIDTLSGSVVQVNQLGSQALTDINTTVQAGTWSTPNINSVRNAITGGAYALSTDANGRIRIVDGTGTGEIDTLSGSIVQVNQLGSQALTDINTTVQAGTWSTPNINSVRNAITGGAYALSTDSNGRVRFVVGTNAGELNTSAGNVVQVNQLGSQALTDINTTVQAGTWSTPNVNSVRNAITGGAYALSTDSNGRMRIVDGTGTGEIDTLSGNIVQVNQLGTQAKADVNAEIVDAVSVDTYAEPSQGTPPATTSLINKLNYLYKALINKITQTSSTLSIYNNASSVVDHKATTSDDGTTYTRDKIGTGP